MSTRFKIFSLLVALALMLPGAHAPKVWAAGRETSGEIPGPPEPQRGKEAGPAATIAAVRPSLPGVVRLLVSLDREAVSGPLIAQVLVWPASGGMTAAFLELPPAQRWVVDLAPPCPGPFRVRLMLAGVSPAGRPLHMQTPVLDVPGLATAPAGRLQRAWSRIAARLPGIKMPSLSGMSPSLWAPRWPVILGAGLLALGLAGLALLLRRRRMQGAGGEDLDLTAWLTSLPVGIARLTLKAQVENLLKDKAALQQALEEMQKERDRLIQDKAALTAEVKQKVQTLQEQAQALEEVQLRVKVSKEEVRAMQEEYMALYARSGADKQTLRKS